jgi:hypothetical protein
VKQIVTVLLFAVSAGAADDARELLAKARTAYLNNRQSERYWNWTTSTTRAVLCQTGAVLEEIPSVTVESPIRTDGRRCNAVLAWGDGREPYLANASADERCQVEQEANEVFHVETLLQTGQVRVQSRSAAAIRLTIRPDRALAQSSDAFSQCVGSIEGAIELDPSTFFPMKFDLRVAGSGCEQMKPAAIHYDVNTVTSARSTLQKGSTIIREYELQRDKAGNRSKDYWILAHAHSERPLRNDASHLIVWGRRFEAPRAKDRRLVMDAKTTASEFASDATVKFTESK